MCVFALGTTHFLYSNNTNTGHVNNTDPQFNVQTPLVNFDVIDATVSMSYPLGTHYLQVSGKASFKYLKFCSLPMVVATCFTFQIIHRTSSQELGFLPF